MAQKTKATLETEVLQLKKENKALQLTVTNLLKEIDRLKDIGLGEIDSSLPPEEQIILKQINYLVAESTTRTLTLDETRGLDLLLKNKRILDDKKPKVNEDEVPEGTTSADLLRIVANGEEIPKIKKKRSKPKTSR